jgi:hypothetical protein
MLAGILLILAALSWLLYCLFGALLESAFGSGDSDFDSVDSVIVLIATAVGAAAFAGGFRLAVSGVAAAWSLTALGALWMSIWAFNLPDLDRNWLLSVGNASVGFAGLVVGGIWLRGSHGRDLS